MAGDVLTFALLVRLGSGRPAWRILATALFAVNPVSVAVTGYHGNTDPLCAALVLAAAVLLDEERHFAAGLALASALNVKLIPTLLVPTLALHCRSVRSAARFLAGTAVGFIPFLPFVVSVPGAFYKAAIAYNSSDMRWGIYGFLLLASDGKRLHDLATKWGQFYWHNGRYVVVSVVALLGVVSRLRENSNAREVSLAVFAAFLVFTPGFGPQYLLYVVPLLTSVSLKRAAIYSMVAGAFKFLVYYDLWTGQRPYYSLFNRHFTLGAAWLGAIVWAQLATIVTGPLWKPRAAICTASSVARTPSDREFGHGG